MALMAHDSLGQVLGSGDTGGAWGFDIYTPRLDKTDGPGKQQHDEIRVRPWNLLF